jgi:hypothetical protein
MYFVKYQICELLVPKEIAMSKQNPKKSASFAASKQITKLEAVKKIARVVRQHRLSYDAFIAVCQQVEGWQRFA